MPEWTAATDAPFPVDEDTLNLVAFMDGKMSYGWVFLSPRLNYYVSFIALANEHGLMMSPRVHPTFQEAQAAVEFHQFHGYSIPWKAVMDDEAGRHKIQTIGTLQ